MSDAAVKEKTGCTWERWVHALDRHAASVRLRTATAPKSMRLDWTDRSIIAVGFTAKGKSKSSVAAAYTKLPDRETVDRLKAVLVGAAGRAW